MKVSRKALKSVFAVSTCFLWAEIANKDNSYNESFKKIFGYDLCVLDTHARIALCIIAEKRICSNRIDMHNKQNVEKYEKFLNYIIKNI